MGSALVPEDGKQSSNVLQAGTQWIQSLVFESAQCVCSNNAGA
jgi:hypothetical protein